MSTSTFVAMGAAGRLFGIHAQIVQAVVAHRDWEGAEPFDMSDAFGIAPSRSDGPPPVLLLGAGESPVPIRAFGAVVLRQIDLARVWPVPGLVRSPSRRQPISAVAFPEGELPLLVLDPIALLAMAKERATS